VLFSLLVSVRSNQLDYFLSFNNSVIFFSLLLLLVRLTTHLGDRTPASVADSPLRW